MIEKIIRLIKALDAWVLDLLFPEIEGADQDDKDDDHFFVI